MHRLFLCFAAEDRYDIVEPIVYHLKNYGIEPWYDRYEMVLGDNRKERNLEEGAGRCRYAAVILSKYTADSECAMEELSIIEARYYRDEVVVFPILYELSPNDIPPKLRWINNLIFKEVDKSSGTREICNHIACKITGDIAMTCNYQSIQGIINSDLSLLSPALDALLHSYQGVDSANLNSRVALLYAIYLIIIKSKLIHLNPEVNMVSRIFERLFSETRLSLAIDYRELWLLENCICILVDSYLLTCTESRI